MARNLHLVFSAPPPDVSLADFSAWYELHTSEILEVDGFRSCRRYLLGPAVAGRRPIVYQHLSAYELEDGSAEPLSELRARRDAGRLTLPSWFEAIRFASYDGAPLEVDELVLPDHLYLVLSGPPTSMAVEDFCEWYATHMRENLTASGFERGWRYRLFPVSVDPEATARPVHAALYEVEGELSSLRAGLDEAFRAGRVDIPAWMHDGEFTSMDCKAASALKSAQPVG